MTPLPIDPETVERYPFEDYLSGVRSNDLPVLDNLANIVSREIDTHAIPFAAIALDLAVERPLELDWREQSRPPSSIHLSQEFKIATFRTLKQQNGGVDPDQIVYAEALHDRMKHIINVRHTLGVATCRLALTVGRTDIQKRMALAPPGQDSKMLWPKRNVWQEIRRQHIDPRYKDQVERFAHHRALPSEGTATRSRNGLLVAVAAYAVHRSRQES